MRRKTIKTPSELPHAWMPLYAAVTEEEALAEYRAKYKQEPTLMITLKQTQGDIIYLYN